MESELSKMLSNLFYPNNKTKDSMKEPSYFDDDFIAMKRKNRLFTNKQKDLCWTRVYIYV